MPRPLRVEFPGAIYYIMTRSNQGTSLFRSASERELFLATLGEMAAKTGVQVHAFCLIRNSIHLVLATPEANLSIAMKWLWGTFTIRINRRRKRFAHLFSGRYKAVLVDGSSRGYFSRVCEYVHLNPARARLLSPSQSVREYRWSSWPAYVGGPSKRPAWLRVDRLLGEYDVKPGDRAGSRRMESTVEDRRKAEDKVGGKLIRGWRYGSEEFADKMQALAAQKRRAGRNHAVSREPSDRRAREVVRGELSRRGWGAAELKRRAKGDPEKAAIALVLKRETSATSQWIADRLAMGSVGNLNRCLVEARRSGGWTKKLRQTHGLTPSPGVRTSH